MSELGLREGGATSRPRPLVLGFEDVGELIASFNDVLLSCDFDKARQIIEGLFAVDRHGDEETSFQAQELQRTDLLCQCLQSYSTRVLDVHTQPRATTAQSRRPTTHFDMHRLGQPGPAKTSQPAPLPHTDEQAIHHLAAVNAMIKRHAASQRFRRIWLKQKGTGGSEGQNEEMVRFQMVSQQSFLVESELRRRQATEEMAIGAKVNMSSITRHMESARQAFIQVEGLPYDREDMWGQRIQQSGAGLTHHLRLIAQKRAELGLPEVVDWIDRIRITVPVPLPTPSPAVTRSADFLRGGGAGAFSSRKLSHAQDPFACARTHTPVVGQEIASLCAASTAASTGTFYNARHGGMPKGGFPQAHEVGLAGPTGGQEEDRVRRADDAADALMKELAREEQAAAAKKNKKKKRKGKARALDPAAAIGEDDAEGLTQQHGGNKRGEDEGAQRDEAGAREAPNPLDCIDVSAVCIAGHFEASHTDTQAHGAAHARKFVCIKDLEDLASNAASERDVLTRTLVVERAAAAALSTWTAAMKTSFEEDLDSLQGSLRKCETALAQARGERDEAQAQRDREYVQWQQLVREKAEADEEKNVAPLSAQKLGTLANSALDVLKMEHEAALQMVMGEVLNRRCATEVSARHDAFVCPIALELMRDPVVAADGHTYERAEIEQWIQRAQTSGSEIRSPQTNEVLAYCMLAPNHSMRSMILQALEDQRRLFMPPSQTS